MANENIKQFTSKLVRTSNVAKELLIIAKTYSIDVAMLDFDVIKTELFVQMPTAKEGETSEFIEIKSDEDKEMLYNKELLTDANFVIKQVYDVDIRLKEDNDPFAKMDMSISGNKSLTSVFAIIKAGSIIEKSEDCAKDLLAYINKRKIRARIVIDLWDEDMHSEIAQIAAKVEVNNGYTFEEDLQLLVSKSLNSVPTIHDKLILHFDGKDTNEDEYGRIDYKSRGFITSAEVGELLISYRKPKTGENGRNCRGEFVEVPPASEKDAPKFTVDDETIETKETDEAIEFYSKKNGYIALDGTMYLIKENLEVSEISFKSTGNIAAGINGDVAIHVQETDAQKDAIGMGVDVEASEVMVEGNVGSNSTVKAAVISIGGQTHKSSVLIAPDIKVNLHRGLAEGEKVEIKRLEQGKVVGNDIFIEQAAGGEVYGKNVRIEILQSHCKVFASESIEIQKFKGSENFISIDQTQVEGNKEAILDLDKKIDEARIAINVALNKVQEKEALLRKNKSTIIDIKNRLIAYKKAGAQLPKSFVEKYKEFQTLQNETELMRKEHRLSEDLYETLKSRRAEFQSGVLDAKIINHDIWRGHNEVVFKLTYPDVSINYKPKEGLRDSVLSLVYDEDEEEYSVDVKTL